MVVGRLSGPGGYHGKMDVSLHVTCLTMRCGLNPRPMMRCGLNPRPMMRCGLNPRPMLRCGLYPRHHPRHTVWTYARAVWHNTLAMVSTNCVSGLAACRCGQ